MFKNEFSCKVFAVFILVLVLFMQVAMPKTQADSISIYFFRGGNKYIFSDNPESIPSTQVYTIEEMLSQAMCMI
jgi:hypothetical protein